MLAHPRPREPDAGERFDRRCECAVGSPPSIQRGGSSSELDGILEYTGTKSLVVMEDEALQFIRQRRQDVLVVAQARVQSPLDSFRGGF